jgi:large subunit ribosomal protein L25
MKQFKLNVTAREGKGRSASRRLRAAGKIPAILYGKQTSPVQVAIDAPEFRRLLKAIGGSTAIIEFQRPDGRPAISFLQEVQKDPLTDEFIHVDLHEVAADEKMDIHVGVHVVGESFGVKNENGVLNVSAHRLRVRCLPKDLPEYIEVDVTELHVGQGLHVGDLKKIPGVVYLDQPVLPVVACVEPAAEEVAPTAAAAATAEGAVEGAVPAEGAAPGAAPAAGAAAGGAAPAAGAKGAAPAAGAKGAAPAAPAAGAKGAAAPAAGAKAPAKK